MSKPKSNNRHSKADCLQTPLVAVKDFCVGSRVRVSSTHPLFGDVICIISALPSPDAAIVELEDGTRERLLLKDLKTLELEPTTKSTGVRFEIIEALSPDEERERHRLELKVERAFYEAGAALRDLRDRRLYRSTHKTFEEYCQQRFGYTRRNVNYTIAAAGVVENLGTNCSQILPTSISQVRLLTALEPEEQRTCWQQAVDLADGKVPTAKIVKGIVERMKAKSLNLATDFCFVGDVFTLAGLDALERKYNGYPCVAIELNDFTINVEVYDTILAVKPENLKKIDAPDARRQLPAIQKRIRQVRSVDQLDRGAEQLLKHLGRQIYLTDVEEKLLSCLETHYHLHS